MEKDSSAAGAGKTGEAKPVAPAVEEKRLADVVDDVPDPDEDDLDDLDATEDGPDDKMLEDMLSSDDFAKQLQAGMADLIGEFEKNVDDPFMAFPYLHQLT
ncbi:pex19 family protein [Colletotrichum tofieldiae]|nr:pex19 family protein [Colletotrichum tofieldiae]